MKTIYILIVSVLLSGCELREQQEISRQYSALRFKAQFDAVETCKKRGGLVIFSSWDGRVVDCK